MDRDSSLAFFLSNDPQLETEGALRADQALAVFAELRRCMLARRDPVATDEQGSGF